MAERGQHWTFSAWTGLLHPAWWLATSLLLLNDHYLKGAGQLAPWLTGKLSDFSGLLMAPLVLAALIAPGSLRAFLMAHLAVGAVFTALKLSQAFAVAWCELGGLFGMTWRVVSDPSDLLTLPALGLSYWVFGPRLRVAATASAWRRLGSTTACGVGFVGIVATSMPPPPRPVLAPQPSGNLYVAYGGQLRELDRATGQRTRTMACDVHPYAGTRFNADALFLAEYAAVAACDLKTGRRLWTRELERPELVHADAERVIVRTAERIIALTPTTGSTLWQLETDSLGAVVLPNLVVIHLPDRSLKFVALRDGSTVARRGALAPRFASLGDALYGFNGSELLMLDATGAIRQRGSHGLSDPERLLTIEQSHVLVAVSDADTHGATLTGIGLADLRPLWRLNDHRLATLTRELAFTHRGIGCNDNTLDARELRTGRRLWHVPWCHYESSVVADDDLVVTLSAERSNFMVVARDPRSGRPLWHSQLPN